MDRPKRVWLAIVHKDVFLKLILNVLELHEIHNDYLLALGKTEIKREMLFDYQLKIADLYSIPIDNVIKLVPNFFDKEKYEIHYVSLQLC